jgi:two-component system LytT family response regulator
VNPITALIVDDEALCRKGIRILLEADPDYRIVGECANGRDAIREISRLKPDVVFLDIHMPEVGGFDVLKALPPEAWPLVIFVTAYDEYAVRAFEVRALDYVLKPFARPRFMATLAGIKTRLREKSASAFGASLRDLVSGWAAGGTQEAPVPAVGGNDSRIDRLLVDDKEAHKIVWVKDLEWIEGADYYVHLHTRNASYLYRERLKNLERRLPAESFFRVHKSAIINLRCLDKLVKDARNQVVALLVSGARVNVSRSRKEKLFAACRPRTDSWR